MGQYHYLINLDKKQFVYPHQIGNGLKLKEQVGWEYSTATVLVMLLAASSRDGGRGGGDFHAEHPLVGSWAGDRVSFVGDYAEAEDIPGSDAPRIYEVCSGEAKTGGDQQLDGWVNVSAGASLRGQVGDHPGDLAREGERRLGRVRERDGVAVVLPDVHARVGRETVRDRLRHRVLAHFP